MQDNNKNLDDLAREFAGTVFGIDYCKDIRRIPEGRSGETTVKDDVNIDGQYIFQNILKSGKIIATNDPSELKAHKFFLERASGDILISGLGLGNSLNEALKKTGIKTITIVESDPDIISLVAPSFAHEIESGQVKIINDNIYNYQPPQNFECIYHAIWATEKETRAAVEDRKKLRDHFKPFCDWHGFIYLSPQGGYREGAKRPKGSKGPNKPAHMQRSIQKAARYRKDEIDIIKRACELSGKSESEIMTRGAIKEAVRIIYKIDDSSLDDLVDKIAS